MLSGCWGITLDANTPSEYTETKEIVESKYGSTQKEILRALGTPDWTENRNGSTYYIYQWKSSEIDIGFVIIPIPVAAVTKVDIYCLLLEFDKNDKLIKHEMRETVDPHVHPWGLDRFAKDCMDLYPLYTSKSEWELQQEIATYCPYADLGDAVSQKRIGDLYYLGAYGIEKNIKKAYVWYNLSANGGNNSAAEQLLFIQKILSPDPVSYTHLTLPTTPY